MIRQPAHKIEIDWDNNGDYSDLSTKLQGLTLEKESREYLYGINSAQADISLINNNNELTPIGNLPVKITSSELTKHSLAVNSNDEYFVVVSIEGEIKLIKSQPKGVIWNKPVLIDTGTEPSLIIDDEDNIHITYIKGGNVQYVEVSSGLSVGTPVEITAITPEKPIMLSNLSIVYIDEDDICYVNNTDWEDITIIEAGATDVNSLDAIFGDVVYIYWHRDGEINYSHNLGAPQLLIETTDTILSIDYLDSEIAVLYGINDSLILSHNETEKTIVYEAEITNIELTDNGTDFLVLFYKNGLLETIKYNISTSTITARRKAFRSVINEITTLGLFYIVEDEDNDLYFSAIESEAPYNAKTGRPVNISLGFDESPDLVFKGFSEVPDCSYQQYKIHSYDTIKSLTDYTLPQGSLYPNIRTDDYINKILNTYYSDSHSVINTFDTFDIFETRVPEAVDVSWKDVASDSTGMKLFTGNYGSTGGRAWLSDDGGETWTETRPLGDANKNWYKCASSGDGEILMITNYNKRIYLSTNRGETWAETQPVGNDDEDWNNLAISNDGGVLACVSAFGKCWISTNQGASWTETQPAGDVNGFWYGLALSSDGSTIVIGGASRLYISTNTGSSWAEIRPVGDTNHSWRSVAVSSNGTKIIAGAWGSTSGDRIYLSSNSGANWAEIQPAGDGTFQWSSVDMSDDGSIMSACVYGYNTNGGRFYMSFDGGTTWIDKQFKGDAIFYWESCSLNSDGSRMFFSDDLGLYTYHLPIFAQDATDIALDETDFMEGSASIGFDTAGAGGIRLIPEQIDLSYFNEVGKFRAWVYTNSATVTLSFGDDSSNYWEIEATTDIYGNALSDWNLIEWDWADATKTGNPKIIPSFFDIIFDTAGSHRIDELSVSLPNVPAYYHDKGLNFIGLAWYEGNKAGYEIRTACEAEGGRFYQDELGNLVFENRQHYILNAEHKQTVLSLNTNNAFDFAYDASKIINYVELQVEPRILQSEEEIWNYGETPAISGGQTLEIMASFQNPVDEITDPVASTDYTANADEDGGGTDKTAQISISITQFASACKIVITNNDAGVVYLTSFKLRGTPYTKQGKELVISEDTISQENYGIIQAQDDITTNKYFQKSEDAQGLADAIIAIYANPLKMIQLKIKGVPDLKLGDIVSVQNPDTQQTTLQRVIRIKTSYSGSLDSEILTRAINQQELRTYFTINVSKINSDDILAP